MNIKLLNSLVPIKDNPGSHCYFWAATPARASFSLRQHPVRKTWMFEGRFPGTNPETVKNIGWMMSYIDGLSKITAIGDGLVWVFDHIHKLFHKQQQQEYYSSIEQLQKDEIRQQAAEAYALTYLVDVTDMQIALLNDAIGGELDDKQQRQFRKLIVELRQRASRHNKGNHD